jgi:hypothetical protein
MDSCLNIGGSSVKEQEKHEMLLFQVHLLSKNGQFQKALDYLLTNKKYIYYNLDIL